MYKLNMELFWENDKTAFHLDIQRRRLYGEHPPLHTLSATQDGKAREKPLSWVMYRVIESHSL